MPVEWSHEAAAAWVQAVGTLLAILVAIAVPWQIHRQERRALQAQTELRGRLTAIQLLPAAQRVRAFADSALAYWEQMHTEPGVSLEQILRRSRMPSIELGMQSILDLEATNAGLAESAAILVAALDIYHARLDRALEWPDPADQLANLRASREHRLRWLQQVYEASGSLVDLLEHVVRRPR